MDAFLQNILQDLKNIENKKVNSYGVSSASDRAILCDCSGSMAGEKFETMVKALKSQANSMDSIISFADDVYLIPMHKIDTLKSCFGMTAMLPAIKLAVTDVRPTTILLITDGDPNVGGGKEKVLEYVTNLTGIVINCIGIGNSESSYWGNELDEDFLTTLAEATGGKYYNADNVSKLESSIKMLMSPDTIQL